MPVRFTGPISLQSAPASIRRIRRCRQGGFSLLELSAVLGLSGLLLVAGYQLLGASQTGARDVDRRAQLAAAEHAVAGFVGLHGRLPCPDTAGNGFENCAGSTQKGWLPFATLGLGTSAPARGTPRLRYMVYRTAGADLASLSDQFNPAKWNGERYSFGQQNGLDLCSGLAVVTGAAPNPGAAHVLSGGVVTNVAYAIVEAGRDADGNGDPFDGALNGSADARVEAPSTAAGTSYDDIVVARGFADLSAMLSCPDTVRSVETLSRTVDIAHEVADQKLWAAILAGVSTGISAVKSGVSALKMGLAIAATVTAAATLSTAVTALSAAIASCVVVVGCALIPSLSAAVATGAAAVVAAAASIALNGAALAANLTATGLSIAVTVKAGIAATPSTTDFAAALPDMKVAVDQAAAKAAAAESEANAARTAANTARTTYEGARTTLYNVGHSFDQAGFPRDANLDKVLADHRDYVAKRMEYEALKGAADNKRKEANDTAAALDAPAFELPSDLPAEIRDQIGSGDHFAQMQQEMRASLEASAARLNNEAIAAEQAAAAALVAANAALATYEASRTSEVNAYKYSYQTTEGETTKTINVDGTAEVRAELDKTTAAYEGYIVKDRAAASKESAAQTARSSATSLQATYASIEAELTKPPANGATPGVIQVWQGADAILRQADQIGTVK